MAWEDDFRDDMKRIRKKMRRWISGDEMEKESFDDEIDMDRDYRKAWTDFNEDEKNYYLDVELPGVNKEDIRLTTTSRSIIIRAEKRKEVENKKDKEGFYSYSRSYAGFAREIPLPDDAKREEIDASFNNGVLNVVIPKENGDGKGKGYVRIR